MCVGGAARQGGGLPLQMWGERIAIGERSRALHRQLDGISLSRQDK